MQVEKRPDIYEVTEIDHDNVRYFPDGKVEKVSKGDYVLRSVADGTERYVAHDDLEKLYDEVGRKSSTPPATSPSTEPQIGAQSTAQTSSTPVNGSVAPSGGQNVNGQNQNPPANSGNVTNNPLPF